MALIKCYECSKEISDTAKACPHCGAGKYIECHECSKKISEDLDTCSNCGAPKKNVRKNYFPQGVFKEISFSSIFDFLKSIVKIFFNIFILPYAWLVTHKYQIVFTPWTAPFFLIFLILKELSGGKIDLYSKFPGLFFTSFWPYIYYKLAPNDKSALNIVLKMHHFYSFPYPYLRDEDGTPMSGLDTIEWENGDKYEGEFKNGKFDGKGTYFSEASGRIYKGLWKNGEFIGEE